MPCNEIVEKLWKWKILFVGAKVQISCVLGLGLARVQFGKYWFLVLI